MKQALLPLHFALLLGALTLCIVELAFSISYAGKEPFAITYERTSVAFLCGVFAAAHLLLVIKKRARAPTALSFYPLCVALAFVTSLVSRASAKGWAPASSEQALAANVIGYSAIAFLVLLCTGTCFWAFTREPRND